MTATYVPKNWRPATDMECLTRDDLKVDERGNLYIEERPPRSLDYTVPIGPQTHITEEYVSSPPALIIVDEAGFYWCLGFTRAPPHLTPWGEYAFNILRNGEDMGEFASRIERRGGKIRIFTTVGWKRWAGNSFI